MGNSDWRSQSLRLDELVLDYQLANAATELVYQCQLCALAQESGQFAPSYCPMVALSQTMSLKRTEGEKEHVI